jgi:hypothetical protein
MYNTFKAQEAHFPVPKPSATITVGTFNAQTGLFHYSVGTYTKLEVEPPDPKPGGNLKPIKFTLTGGKVEAINVFNLTLRFEVTSRVGNVSVSVSGHPTVQAAASYVDVPVGTASAVDFTISCNGKSFSPEIPLLIDRPIAGAGAMTIPALPVAVIYAPPVDSQKMNVASWTSSDSAGNTTTLAFSQGQSQGKPVPSQFQSWADMASGMKTVGEVLSKIPTPYTMAAGAALGILSGLMGSTSATETKGTTVTNQNSLTVTMGTTNTVATSPTAGGPGQGDIIYFLKNARVCWFSQGNTMKLALLGWDADEVVTAAFLKQQGTQHGLDQKTVDALLKLDPFVAGGPQANLPGSRFAPVETIDINGAAVTRNVTYTLTQSNLQQTVNTTVDVENDSAGFLSFLGIGVPETQTLQSTMSQTSATETTSTHTVAKQLQLNGAGNEYYSVEVYCDVVFGTFAFRPVAVAPQPRLSGVALDKNGKPMASQPVTLVSNGHTFVTMTDAAGKFAFRAGTIAPGQGKLSAGAATSAVRLASTPVLDLELKG